MTRYSCSKCGHSLHKEGGNPSLNCDYCDLMKENRQLEHWRGKYERLRKTYMDLLKKTNKKHQETLDDITGIASFPEEDSAPQTDFRNIENGKPIVTDKGEVIVPRSVKKKECEE